jgi:hypothetical protein
MATYYVKNAGDDSKDGLSDANAWETISKVNASSFSANDVIQFNRGDTWHEKLTPPSSGSIGNHIHFTAYGSSALPLPIIDGDGIRDCTDANGVDYIKLSYLDLYDGGTGDLGFGVDYIYCENPIIEDCVVRNAKNANIGLWGCNNLEVRRCICHSSDNEHGIYISPEPGYPITNFIIEYNEVYGNSDTGIQVNSNATLSFPFGHIRYNHSHDNGSVCINAIAGDGVLVYGNVLADPTAEWCVNVGWDPGPPYGPGNAALNWKFYNNTFIITSGRGGAWVGTLNTGHLFYNNIFYIRGSGSYLGTEGGGSFTADWNCYYAEGSGGTEYGSNSISDNPDFTDVNNDDFTLSSVSPCIDATSYDTGYNYALDPDSSWPDSVSILDQDSYGTDWEMGAYVYETGVAAPAFSSITATGAANNKRVDCKDTLTIAFDKNTNQPSAGTKTLLDAMFTFSEALGDDYTGEWAAADTLVITVQDPRNNDNPETGSFQLTAKVGNGIKDVTGTSAELTGVSPTLSGGWRGLVGAPFALI